QVKPRMPRDGTAADVHPLQNREIRLVLARFLRAMRKGHLLEVTERLRSFDRPTLLNWPPDDPVFSYDRARRLTEMLPDARLVDVEDSRGFVSEDQPKRLAEEIAHFIGETERTV